MLGGVLPNGLSRQTAAQVVKPDCPQGRLGPVCGSGCRERRLGFSVRYHDSLDINDEWQREVAAIRMIAKLPTIAAMAYK
ncbi:MAG: hypothetical protein IOD05_04710, partial [Rhodobacter sp.]|nr:hypothetical protein [Rhodobacter sp.]